MSEPLLIFGLRDLLLLFCKDRGSIGHVQLIYIYIAAHVTHVEADLEEDEAVIDE